MTRFWTQPASDSNMRLLPPIQHVQLRIHGFLGLLFSFGTITPGESLARLVEDMEEHCDLLARLPALRTIQVSWFDSVLAYDPHFARLPYPLLSLQPGNLELVRTLVLKVLEPLRLLPKSVTYRNSGLQIVEVFTRRLEAEGDFSGVFDSCLDEVMSRRLQED